jgi:hypothetical protein
MFATKSIDLRAGVLRKGAGLLFQVYMDYSFSCDETNQDYRLDFWMYFGFVYGILFDGRVSARHLPWSQTFCLLG